jgi:hypothetical protein
VVFFFGSEEMEEQNQKAAAQKRVEYIFSLVHPHTLSPPIENPKISI